MIMELLSSEGRKKEGVLTEAFLREKEVFIAVQDQDIVLFATNEGERHIIVYTSLEIVHEKVKNLEYKKISIRDLMRLINEVGGFDFCAVNPFTDIELFIESSEELKALYSDVLISRILDNMTIYVATFKGQVAKISDGLITYIKIFTEEKYIKPDQFEYEEMLSWSFKSFLKECGNGVTHIIINKGSLDEVYADKESVLRILDKIS